VKPRILLLDEPHPKAREIMESVAECIKLPLLKELPRLMNKLSKRVEDYVNTATELTLSTQESIPFAGVYTQLTPIKINCPVFCPCTGVDHIKAPKVIYLNDEWKATEGQQITSTAEHTWSLILQLAKMKRMQLKDKTLGIIGYGRIGRRVGRYALAFGMAVIPMDKDEPFVQWKLMKTLLKQSDIITLHVPLNEETRGMIGEKEFDMMKPGALLVNTSRADVVDEKALINWLQATNEGNYYADDFESRTIFCPNAIQTDHIAGNCLEVREMTDIYIAKQIVRYIQCGNTS